MTTHQTVAMADYEACCRNLSRAERRIAALEDAIRFEVKAHRNAGLNDWADRIEALLSDER